jgi:hypothetical protein
MEQPMSSREVAEAQHARIQEADQAWDSAQQALLVGTDQDSERYALKALACYQALEWPGSVEMVRARMGW